MIISEPSSKPISEKLSSLRSLMKREHIGAFIFPSTDPHHGEYVPDHWKGREWISGFDGSAGTAVVTMHSAALWTDSRYFLAAAEELRGTDYILMKQKVSGTPTIEKWLSEQLTGGESTEVAVDGMVCSYAESEKLKNNLRVYGLTLRTNIDALAEIWTDRPQLPDDKVVMQPLKYAGEDAVSKLARVRRETLLRHADALLVSALDSIAWILNLRGSDVHCNPVFVSYLLIEQDSATLFVDKRKLTTDVKAYLSRLHVGTDDYDNIKKAVSHYSGYNILLDPSETAFSLCMLVKAGRMVSAASPVPAMKAIKNSTEIAGFRNVMIKDGVAMVKFLRWLLPAVRHGGQTEMSVSDKLLSLRAEQPLFKDISFDTIAGYEEHGAIVHYEATETTDAPLRPEGLLLLDSGAQYLDGTTDITRTIALGPVTEEQKLIYTLVLKSHIQLELAKFPDGASGTQIDAIAREPLWKNGYNFLHGTGHGVGAYLNVHEGPHQIRMEYMPAPLHAGMTVTDEPGLYLAGKFGVRTENTLLITEFKNTEYGKFLQMEPLTLCPIDMTPVIKSMLTTDEKAWIDSYHALVFEKLAPHLDGDDYAWLEKATKPF